MSNDDCIWGTSNEDKLLNVSSPITKFEDNFVPENQKISSQLPDSDEYLKSLEKKLEKLKSSSTILQQLTNKREECLNALLLNSGQNTWNNTTDLDLDTPLSDRDSKFQEIYRHIDPVRPLSVGEVLHIVKYDQLQTLEQDQHLEDSTARNEQQKELEDNKPEN